MVLDGLEDNVDFWMMDLSDDEVPIPGSPPNHSSKCVHLCRVSHSADVNADDATEDGQGATVPLGSLDVDGRVEKECRIARPEKLPNGKYRGVLVILCTYSPLTAHLQVQPSLQG
jgi:hypothetical protein